MHNLYQILLISLFLMLYVVVFVIGYILGQIRLMSGVSNHVAKNKNSNTIDKNSHTLVSIDSSTVVTNIETSGLEKKYVKLGEIKQSEEKISSAINKLKNMKG